MGLGYWLLSMFLALFLFTSDMTHRDANQASENAVSENLQRARQTVQYINTINDYLYDHPQTSGVPSDSVLGFTSVPSLTHIIQSNRVFVYQPDRLGLMGALATVTRNSALLGHVKNRRLIDNQGNDMQVTVPDVIPDTYLVYLN
ncbi:type IV pilus biogenesis protein PilM (plasmid) [Rahnella variigena]|uniref:type IV pilus biogenesis protein PilM n=1 Tax=Rahnella variigena TaxID=574964 RepID=UPI003CED7B7A